MKFILALIDNDYNIVLEIFNTKTDLLDYLKRKDIETFVDEDVFNKPCQTRLIGYKNSITEAHLKIVED